MNVKERAVEAGHGYVEHAHIFVVELHEVMRLANRGNLIFRGRNALRVQTARKRGYGCGNQPERSHCMDLKGVTSDRVR
jgi:hypothetical protein